MSISYISKHIARLVFSFLIISAFIFTGHEVESASKARSSKAKPSNRLEEMMQALTINGEPFIKSYKLEGPFAYLKINPHIWNNTSAPQQRQICDSLAATDVWKRMGLVNAWLLVGHTTIGRIKPTLSGGHEFYPELNSLK